MSLIAIPELALHCLAQLAPSRYDDTSVRTLVACTKASRALRDIAQTDSLWFQHCIVRWKRGILEGADNEQWYQLYTSRRKIDRRALDLLSTIITTPSKRGEAVVELVAHTNEMWDAMRMEAGCAVPPDVRDVWKREEKEWEQERWEGVGEEWRESEGKGKELDDEVETDPRTVKDDWIQRRWWAKQVLGTMERSAAVVTMTRIFLGAQPDPMDPLNARHFEDGLKGLSGLMGVNVSEISHNYDKLAAECGRRLTEDGVCIDPHSEEFDLKDFSAGVCNWMASQSFKKADDDRQYYDLMNHFPHKFLTTHRRTLPMSLVCVFVAIATRLGLRSAPVGFPGHVHAWIALPSYTPSYEESDWEEEHPTQRLHVDVFYWDTQPFLSTDEMAQALQNLQVPVEQHRYLMHPSTATDMVMRAANNILHSVTRVQQQISSGPSAEVRGAALYASAMTFFIARPQAADVTRFVTGVVSVIKAQFPLDTEPVLSQLLTMLCERNPHRDVGIHIRSAIAQLRESNVEVKRRAEERWWVGMLFRHAKYGYVGVVLGWDAECEAGEEWIYEAGVDSLPKGRKQPFYTVLAADGTSRYVAQENMIPLPSLATETEDEQKVTWEVVRVLMMVGTWTIEQTFSRVEVDEELGRAWFFPAVNTAQEYPDDTEVGRAYMQSAWHRYP